jgi:hypothetical protein
MISSMLVPNIPAVQDFSPVQPDHKNPVGAAGEHSFLSGDPCQVKTSGPFREQPVTAVTPSAITVPKIACLI